MSQAVTDGNRIEQFIPPEGVPITFAIASIGTRFGAQFLDIVFTSIIMFVCAVAKAYAAGNPDRAHAIFDAYLPLARYEQ
ncbi:hypothetical protein ACCS96_39710, partial [Rhizobium ruizarguesonis]